MAYGIDPRLPKEINDWNSPEHWIRSDLQSALDRGQVDKAKVLQDTLNTTLASVGQEDKNIAEVKKAEIDKYPDLLKARKEVAPSAAAQQAVDTVAKSGIGQPVDNNAIDYSTLLSKRWALPGKELLFK
jgi:hypothetical protein